MNIYTIEMKSDASQMKCADTEIWLNKYRLNLIYNTIKFILCAYKLFAV